ncbi:MAG TPA: phosphoribosylamine--glycine ligase [Thermodesulfobacteriaceae bacterium]|nr:phosphoribosylamine--glycine ligase [Thermodesulfobacteriaceae bacterium]
MKKKNVLVVGSGGREHALCWKLASSRRINRVFCAPGNAGIALHARCIPIKAGNLEGLAEFASREQIDLTIIGPEAPLAEGIVDFFLERGLTVFGPTRAAARIESSKVFTKELLTGAGVPTGAFRVFTDPESALRYIEDETGLPVALKADGLAAGKGVILAHTMEEAKKAVDTIMVKKAFGDAGDRLIVEEFLTGEEASFMAITDGKTILPLATSQDHKPVFDNDQGPNTGGMGAYSPAPVVTSTLFQEIMDTIMRPTVRAMEEAGAPYRGVLYGGIIIENGRARVIEYNCRFGDPEAQPILMRLHTDIMDVFEAAVEGRLAEVELEWDPRPAVCVVLASGGYPGACENGKVIHGLEKVSGMDDVMVFHAGTASAGDRYVTAGGRVLSVTALGDNIEQAIERAYEAVEKISWEGMHYRRDIGGKALKYVSGQNKNQAVGGGPEVAIVMGSLSDREVMEGARKVLDEFGVACEMKVASAHRSPRLAARYTREAEQRGIKVFIAGAGMAAHLAGAVAAHTTLPVIGVPIASSPLNGMDALLSTAQMPPGIPVATMAIGGAGAKNAAMLAVEILAVSRPELADRLKNFRKKQAEAIEKIEIDT